LFDMRSYVLLLHFFLFDCWFLTYLLKSPHTSIAIKTLFCQNNSENACQFSCSNNFSSFWHPGKKDIGLVSPGIRHIERKPFFFTGSEGKVYPLPVK
jgi:hypothetical protein